MVAILATIDKIKRKVKFTFKNCLCAIAAFFGFLLTTAIVLYQLGYVIFYQQFYDKFSKTNDMPWGSFIGNPSQAKGWLVGTVFFSFSFLFAFFPLINKSLISFFTYLTKKPTYSDPNHDPWLAKVVSNNQLQKQRRVKYLLQPFTPKIVKSPAKKSSQPVAE